MNARIHDVPAEVDLPGRVEDGDGYLARLALRARLAEDEACRARHELQAASERLRRGRARVLGGVHEVSESETARLGG